MVVGLKATMHIKFYLLIFFMLYTIRAVIVADENDDKNKEMMNLCYNSSLEGKYTDCENHELNVCPFSNHTFSYIFQKCNI